MSTDVRASELAFVWRKKEKALVFGLINRRGSEIPTLDTCCSSILVDFDRAAILGKDLSSFTS